MKRNKRFRHCTYNLSVPPPLLTFSLLLRYYYVIYLFASATYNLNPTLDAIVVPRETQSLAPRVFFFFCVTLAKLFKCY
jgi:hypothetical protein